MGKPTGFMEYDRAEMAYQPAADRVVHYNEFVLPPSDAEMATQGARCMDCGIPYCHQGCPVNNIIPDWNDLVYQDDWQSAIEVLHSTNNFPEFTGRICPAPCEAACTLNIDDKPVAIKAIECAIVDKAWEKGWVKPQVPMHRSGKRIAVVGSGPAGLACAQQLARAGHAVSLYEKEDRIGGLLRYGIPDFKLAKKLIDRRMAQMRAEGVEFHTHCHVGVDIPMSRLLGDYDAVVLSGGAEKPRDLTCPGASYAGIHFAMDFLRANSKRVQGVHVPDERLHQRPGQARRGHRRRRHRLRLHRHLQPPRRQVRHPDRDPRQAPGQGGQGPHLAQLAEQAAHLLLPGRRLRARLERAHQVLRARRQRQRPHPQLRPGALGQGRDRPLADVRGTGQRGSAQGRPGAARHGLRAPRARRHARRAEGAQGPGAGPPRQRPRQHRRPRRLPDQHPRRVRRRRHAPRPVAGGLGHPRRPAVRTRGG
jgi:hypothetical protein